MALAAAGRARGPGHLVAGAELAASDLGGRDVDVALRLVQAAQPQEPIALRHPVEDTGDRLRFGLFLRLGPVRPIAPSNQRMLVEALRATGRPPEPDPAPPTR